MLECDELPIPDSNLRLDQGWLQEHRGCKPFDNEELFARGGLEIGPGAWVFGALWLLDDFTGYRAARR